MGFLVGGPWPGADACEPPWLFGQSAGGDSLILFLIISEGLHGFVRGGNDCFIHCESALIDFLFILPF